MNSNVFPFISIGPWVFLKYVILKTENDLNTCINTENLYPAV